MAVQSVSHQQNFPGWNTPELSHDYAPARRKASRSPTEDSNTWRFVTASKPEDFKDQTVMRGVRSHVMFDVIERRQRMPVPERATTKSKVTKSSTATTGQRTRGPSSASSSKAPASFHRSDSALSNPDNPEYISNETALQILRQYPRPRGSPSVVSTTSRSDTAGDVSSPESVRAKNIGWSWPGGTSRASGTPSISSTANTEDVEQPLVRPPEGGQKRMNLYFEKAFPTLGPFEAFSPFESYAPRPLNPFSAYDPFHALPSPSNSSIDVERLKYYCHHYFGTRAMARVWLREAVGTRESFLSTLSISMSHKDAMEDRQAPGPLTTFVNTEVIHLIREALTERWRAIKDSTIMSVTHMLCSQLINAGEEERANHEKGLKEMIVQRGGLQRLGLDNELAAISSAMCFTSAILRESQPDSMFLEIEASAESYKQRPVIPESPLFCPRGEFLTIERSKQFNQATKDLLNKLRELTDLCLNSETGSPRKVEARKQSLLIHISNLPSAARLAGDRVVDRLGWRYEAVRLVAILYANSLVNRKPLSTSASECKTSTSTPVFTVATSSNSSILAALVVALKNSDTSYSTCWSDVTGVLYWVTLVGAAAARVTPQKRYLTALNVRCAIVLAFEHRDAVVLSLKKMLRIVDLCSGAGTVEVVEK